MSAAEPGARDPLGARVRALFMNLAHAGEPTGQDVVRGQAGSIDEGTLVQFFVQASAGHITEVRYRAYGCPFTLATCEWLAGRLVGQTLREGSKEEAVRSALGTPQDWAAALDIPRGRLGRLLVVEDALRDCCSAAIRASISTRRAIADESMTDSG